MAKAMIGQTTRGRRRSLRLNMRRSWLRNAPWRAAANDGQHGGRNAQRLSTAGTIRAARQSNAAATTPASAGPMNAPTWTPDMTRDVARPRCSGSACPTV